MRDVGAEEGPSQPKWGPASSVDSETTPDRKTARRRQAIIAANAELRERELIKLASWSAAIADVLRRRGVEDPTATLTAEVATAVFRTAFDRWIDETENRDFPEVFRESLGQLKALTAVG